MRTTVPEYPEPEYGGLHLLLGGDGGEYEAHPEVVRDNYIPVFDGQPSSYKEYRKRVALYYKKMSIGNKKSEATINLLTSLAGPVWKQVEHLADTRQLGSVVGLATTG